MDKGFSISGHLLSCLQPDDPREARLRMLCVTISKDMPIPFNGFPSLYLPPKTENPWHSA